MHYLIKYALICIHSSTHLLEYWIKPGSKLLQRDLWIYFCYPINQNILSIALKTIFAIFFGIKCYTNQARNNIFKSASVNVFII